MFPCNISCTVKASLVGFLITSLTGFSQPAQTKAKPPSEDTLIYETIGIMVAKGSGLGKLQFTDAQIEIILAGMKKGFSMEVMPPEYAAVQEKVQALMMEKMQSSRQAEQVTMAEAAKGNKAKGKEYLTLLSKQEGVNKDPSGFYYEILKEGKGPSPTMESSVRLHYHGTLIDGTVFDSSVDRGQPANFPMSGVIKGFSGGLTKTQVGGKVRIYIPSELGYGDNPRPGGKIKPGDTLIFECELLEIN